MLSKYTYPTSTYNPTHPQSTHQSYTTTNVLAAAHSPILQHHRWPSCSFHTNLKPSKLQNVLAFCWSFGIETCSRHSFSFLESYPFVFSPHLRVVCPALKDLSEIGTQGIVGFLISSAATFSPVSISPRYSNYSRNLCSLIANKFHS